MKFVVDGMLGKTARFLRILGNDVKYFCQLSDDELIKLAKREGRLLLTRDRELHRLARAQGVESFLVEGRTEPERLASLAREFGIKLDIDVRFSRCPKCNSEIRPVSKEEVRGKVPETTFLSYSQFWRCSGCGQIYWRGPHWRRISKILGEARAILEAGEKPSRRVGSPVQRRAGWDKL